MKDEKLELINKKRFTPVKKPLFLAAGVTMAMVGVTVAGAIKATGENEGAGAKLVAVASLVLGAISILFNSDKFLYLLFRITDYIKNRKTKESKIAAPSRYKLLKLSEIFFSAKIQKEVFLQAMADWDEEVYEALEKDKDANLVIINARNAYAFILTMWQKSPIGDLIEFVIKIAKQ